MDRGARVAETGRGTSRESCKILERSLSRSEYKKCIKLRRGDKEFPTVSILVYPLTKKERIVSLSRVRKVYTRIFKLRRIDKV